MQGQTFGSNSNPKKWWPGIPNVTALPSSSIYLIYALIALFIIGVIIILVDLYYPFLPVNPFGRLSTTARNGQLFWTGGGENLIVPTSLSPTVRADTYSMSFQLGISDSRVSSGKYRHIIHRGSNPCGLSSAGAGPSGHAGIRLSDLPPSDYSGNGLPDFMNPGIFLDQYTNDMYIFVHTTYTDSNGPLTILESTTVSDLPIGQPLNIGIVCNQKTLEVYVGCKLYTTMLFKGTLFMPTQNNAWYGRYCAFPFSGTVQNLMLWDAPLSATDMIRGCRASSMTIPQSCASSKNIP
jgi:hypothetical protein